MTYGISNKIEIINGELIKTPVGYVAGIEKIVEYNTAYNYDSNPYIIEVGQDTLPQGLNEIIL